MKCNSIYLVLSGLVLIISMSLAVFSKNHDSNSLLNENVEALMDGEADTSEGVLCFMYIYDSGQPGYYLQVRDCGTCEVVTAEEADSSSKCYVL